MANFNTDSARGIEDFEDLKLYHQNTDIDKILNEEQKFYLKDHEEVGFFCRSPSNKEILTKLSIIVITEQGLDDRSTHDIIKSHRTVEEILSKLVDENYTAKGSHKNKYDYDMERDEFLFNNGEKLNRKDYENSGYNDLTQVVRKRALQIKNDQIAERLNNRLEKQNRSLKIKQLSRDQKANSKFNNLNNKISDLTARLKASKNTLIDRRKSIDSLNNRNIQSRAKIAINKKQSVRQKAAHKKRVRDFWSSAEGLATKKFIVNQSAEISVQTRRIMGVKVPNASQIDRKIGLIVLKNIEKSNSLSKINIYKEILKARQISADYARKHNQRENVKTPNFSRVMERVRGQKMSHEEMKSALREEYERTLDNVRLGNKRVLKVNVEPVQPQVSKIKDGSKGQSVPLPIEGEKLTGMDPKKPKNKVGIKGKTDPIKITPEQKFDIQKNKNRKNKIAKAVAIERVKKGEISAEEAGLTPKLEDKKKDPDNKDFDK